MKNTSADIWGPIPSAHQAHHEAMAAEDGTWAGTDRANAIRAKYHARRAGRPFDEEAYLEQCRALRAAASTANQQ